MKRIKVFLVVVTIILLSLLLYQNQLPKITTQLWKPVNKTILYWTPQFRRLDFDLGLGSEIFENCSYNNCYTTHDKSHLPIDQFDAIIFHSHEYQVSKYSQPEKRNPNQVYVFATMESPHLTPSFIRDFNNFYNWTMTYRLDSDLVRLYGSIEEKQTGYKLPTIEEIQQRPKKIAWFVSRCKSPGKRELLVDAIKKYIPVDVYGKCGTLECSRKNETKCYEILEKNYKFYLSFENSMCEDYITEKLFNVLKRNVIPIVFGGGNYTIATPPKSIINVLDFKSVEDLIKFVNYLDANTEEYLRYFEWKKSYVAHYHPKDVLCKLCEKLNQPIETKVYSNIVEWWRGKNSDKCYKNIEKIL